MSALLALLGVWLGKRPAGLEYFRDNRVMLQTFVDSFVDDDPKSPRHDVVVDERHGFKVCRAWKDGPCLHFLVSASIWGGPNEEYVFAPTRDAQISLLDAYVGKCRGLEMTFVAEKWIYLCYHD
ncbi:MAG: hypothetical protein K1X57_16095 [Gemmataceae bacterium]|nr:hypothetical protein [Gemmataceae bacterium]